MHQNQTLNQLCGWGHARCEKIVESALRLLKRRWRRLRNTTEKRLRCSTGFGLEEALHLRRMMVEKRKGKVVSEDYTMPTASSKDDPCFSGRKMRLEGMKSWGRCTSEADVVIQRLLQTLHLPLRRTSNNTETRL